jgi:putative ABC transport system ATP-binding protein
MRAFEQHKEKIMASVSVMDVEKSYRQGDVTVTALSGITVSVERGEFTALAGPSGSGKTTLLNMIGGLDLPDKGEIIVDGRNYRQMKSGDLADLRLRRIGFVFQAYNLIPVLTAAENVEYILRLQGVEKAERKKRVRAMLDEVGLSGMHDRKPAELSGGQQQRVAVARAIVSDPAIVLADEPTANLDSKNGEKLLELMKTMNREKAVTFIFSTHDSMVMEHARRIIYIRDGQVADDRRKES